MENEKEIIFEIEEKIRDNFKQLSYSFSLLSCYFQQLSSPLDLLNEKEKTIINNNQIKNNINLSILSGKEKENEIIKEKENEIIKEKDNEIISEKEKKEINEIIKKPIFLNEDNFDIENLDLKNKDNN